MREIPPLLEGVEITDIKTGTATFVFQKWWQEVTSVIKALFASQQNQITAIAAAQAAANAANTAAAAANTAAAAAQGAADNVASQNNLVNSYPTGVTITATDAGTNVTVAISSHTRHYGNASTVSVNSGNITSLNYSTRYYIYYDDVSRSGGAVTYQATTSEDTAAQLNNRHLVGSVTTPAAAAGPTGGNYVRPPGVGNIP